uniref:NB-ARC domain-containing protein n=1 Tax=Triticum urartu TaxID=4572 RepID=A0A8R7TS56_TRIUA
MASASITFVLNRLGELAVKEAALLSGVGDHIRLLRDKLEWLQTFIQDADQERRDGANQYVGLWVRQTRPSASGASSSAHNSTINTVPAWYADEGNEVVGFKDERAELQRYLLAGDDTSRSVMSLVGESGTGKSTLAWEVYDSPIIRKHFDVRAWINVPPQIRDDDILYFIYKRLCPESEACEQKNSITEKVHKALSLYLKNKRYLVMLDGLVNFSNWHSILHSLPQKEKGSRV